MKAPTISYSSPFADLSATTAGHARVRRTFDVRSPVETRFPGYPRLEIVPLPAADRMPRVNEADVFLIRYLDSWEDWMLAGLGICGLAGVVLAFAAL
jgi:hypothetical protein